MKKLKNALLFVGIAAVSFTACTNKEEKKIADKEGQIDTLAVNIAARYVQNYAPHSDTAMAILNADGKPDTIRTPNSRAIWFSLKKLKAFIKVLEKEDGDGIRFYFATYDKSYPKGDKDAPKKEYWGHNTLVMVSTKKVLVGDTVIHQDFFVPTGGFKPKGFIVGNPPENRGEMCPPPVRCDSVGAALIEKPTIK